MKASKIAKYMAAGFTISGFALNPSLQAQTTEVFFVGANASQSILYYQASNVLNGGTITATISPTNSTVRDYTGTVAGQPSLGTVTIHFSLLGGIQGLQDLANQNDEATAGGSNFAPTVAVSSASPGAVGLPSSPFTVLGPTLVVPYAFIKYPSASALADVTNLTQRQAAYLEGAAGTAGGCRSRSLAAPAPTLFIWWPQHRFRGADGNRRESLLHGDNLDVDDQFQWRACSRCHSAGGQTSGSNVRTLVKAIGNALGTVAASDISSDTPLAYEGVPYSITNVENGTYPLWGYENYYLNSGNGAPSPAQYQIITNLFGRRDQCELPDHLDALYRQFRPVERLASDAEHRWRPDYAPQ
jgi:hypothetical protein